MQIHKVYIYAALATFCLALLLLISPDSYTHGAYNRIDSAWMFMCGKAWINGMTPYVDFTDSKGPILWLIYGAGYLLSQTNYHGVFWISWLWYIAIYIYTYKTVFIFLQGSRKSFLCTILMTLSFFNPWFHYETRAEDFTLLFIIISLYIVCSKIYKDKRETTFNRDFFILGNCFAILLLIKFNIAAIQAIFPLYLYYFCIKERYSYIKPIVYGLTGVMIVIVPFIIYFFILGNLNAFIQEYFLNTMQTVDSENLMAVYLREWLEVINEPARLTLFIFILLGGVLMSQELCHDRYFPLFSSVFVFALTIRHALWPYYFNTCSFCILWLFCFTLLRTNKPITFKYVTILSLIVFSYSLISNIFTSQVSRPLYFRHYPEEIHFNKVSKIMSHTTNPTLINAGYHEFGYGIEAHSLPGGKYWALQNGAFEAMIVEHRNEILSGKSDYIFVYNTTILQIAGLTLNDLFTAGYTICYEWGDPIDRHYLLTRLPQNQQQRDGSEVNL